MSSERVPTRSEVMGWGPPQLSDYLKRLNLSGCDKAVVKNSISGARFINLSDHDLQKFPKVHAPLISKISAEISKKDEKRGLFSRKPTPRYQEPEMPAESQGWAEDEFDEDFDDDYESPYSGDDAESVEDYELPNEAANDYEPPPSQPSEDLKVCPSLPIGDNDYIDNRNCHASSRGPPPVVTPRPSASTISAPSPRLAGEASRSQNSPHTGRRAAGKSSVPAEPPQISRENKPGRHLKSTPSPIRGAHQNTVDRPSTHSWKSQPEAPDLPVWPKPPALPRSNTSVSRSNTFAKYPPLNKFDAKREQQPHDEVLKHNTFPLHNKKLPPCPGPAGLPPHHGDSLPSNFPAAGSLPQKLQSAIAEQRYSFRGPPPDRQSFNSPPTSKADTQDLDPRWYVGQVSRGQAEGCLKHVRRDGAYLVRDSVRQLDGQPFTLMVFYQEKVYNIQIRQQNHQFLLGTGLKVQEPFPSVRDIIYHYSQFPLLLIDAKKKSMNQQNQCLLSDPAGYLMTGQNWT